MKILSIIVPVFNEKETIEAVLKKVKAAKTPGYRKEIIVVDDASTDGSGKLLAKLSKRIRFKFVKHPKNKGKGAAVKSALKQVAGDLVITQDADLEYDPKDYQTLLKNYAAENPVIYGSRKNTKARRGYLLCYLCGQFLTTINNILYSSNITDINTGYKLFRADIIKNANLQVDGFDFCHEITAKVLKAGYRIKEVPINYYPRSYAEGKKVMIGDALLDLWTTIKYRFVD